MFSSPNTEDDCTVTLTLLKQAIDLSGLKCDVGLP